MTSGALELHCDDDLEDFVKRLCKEPGIGLRSAHYLAMRGLCQSNAFLTSDLGIIKMLSTDDNVLKPKQIEAMALMQPFICGREGGSLIELPQIHTFIQVGNLLTIPIKHQRVPAIGFEEGSRQASF